MLIKCVLFQSVENEQIIYSKISPSESPNKFVLGNVDRDRTRVEYAEIDHIFSQATAKTTSKSHKAGVLSKLHAIPWLENT